MPEPKKRPAIDEKLAKELALHKGQWVAVQEGRVVASGASAREALQAALSKGITDPIIFRVASHAERLSLI